MIGDEFLVVYFHLCNYLIFVSVSMRHHIVVPNIYIYIYTLSWNIFLGLVLEKLFLSYPASLLFLNIFDIYLQYINFPISISRNGSISPIHRKLTTSMSRRHLWWLLHGSSILPSHNVGILGVILGWTLHVPQPCRFWMFCTLWSHPCSVLYHSYIYIYIYLYTRIITCRLGCPMLSICLFCSFIQALLS